MATAAPFEYALTSPPLPRSIPPKYLVTTIAISVTSFFFYNI